MKVPYRWLLEYVDCPWEPEELADRLTMCGLKVEAMHPVGQGVEGVVTARVDRLERHPEADSLYVAAVSAGDRTVTVVTGADNVRVGDVVPLAPAGARLPGGRVIEKAVLRGVASDGMLCSEAELQLGDDAGGIMILPPDTPVGAPLGDVLALDDWVLELEVYPNRPDCLGVVGVAREVAAMCGKPLRLPDSSFPEEGPSAADATRVTIEDDDLCRRYIAHLADGVRVGPSPAWLQQRLRAVGMRPISNVVDITNYVMHEWGQPLHAFDFTTLAGGEIRVRRARPGESLRTLDGRDRTMAPDMLVIADAERPVAVAGIMGGADTEVGDGTEQVLLESACFQPLSVRRTARQLGLRTEASHRFEKGLDPELPLIAARRALHLLHRLAGARVFAGAVDAYPRPATQRTVLMSPARVNRFLGLELTPEVMTDWLERLEFRVRPAADGQLEVEVPFHRRDVEREADLAEEIVRMHGFDGVPSTLPGGAARSGGPEGELLALDRVRDVLVGLGFLEAVTYSFVSPRYDDDLRLDADHPWRRHVRLRNPLSEEQSVMRTNMIGGLLEAAARNRARRVRDVHLFEIGATFEPAANPDEQPAEPRKLGLLMTGRMPESVWGLPERRADFFALKGAIEELAVACRVRPTFHPSSHPSLHPGRQAEIRLDDEPVGIVGEVHPLVAQAFEAPEGTCVAEIALSPWLRAFDAVPRFQGLPRYPLVRRDLALLVPKERTAAAVEDVMRRAAGPWLEELTLFDVYEGPQVPEGYRSLAYALGFRSPERTLTDDEVTEVVTRVEAALEAEAGVRVRR